MVTATLLPFARQGSRIDVAVSALGDSKSLLGGTLLVTPLLGADGEAYAVAQGALSTGGFEAQGDAETVTRGVPTAARIPAGAIIEREVQFALDDMTQVRVALRNPDFTTAERIAGAINDRLGPATARGRGPGDRGRCRCRRPMAGRVAQLLTEIEQLPIEPDTVAKILIDERSGIIVMGENVQISRVAVAQGNLTVRITETPQVSQPNPLADGRTVEVPRTDIAGRRPVGQPHDGARAGRDAQRPRRRSERARRRAARSDRHPAGDQGCGRAAGRDRGDLMTMASS